jgi:3-phosphoshikimate 1-carboxyvinyltransferase
MKLIRPSDIKGKIRASPSKSLMIRATASALLSEGASRIMNPSSCADAMAGLRVAEALGARVKQGVDELLISPGGEPGQGVLNCGESGLCMRMFTPIAALCGREITITGEGSLLSRPMRLMEGPLRDLGIIFRTSSGYAPLTVRGPVRGGRVLIDGSLSSQFLTGLLTALPLCPQDSEVHVENLKSKPYAAMTVSLLSLFGVSVVADKDFAVFMIRGGQRYRGTVYSVDGDWSGAAFLLAAAAIRGEVTIDGLDAGSVQADRQVLEALMAAGAGIEVSGHSVTVRPASLRGFNFDAAECPDLFPPLVALACSCAGRSRIHGVGRLKHKESDRAAVLLKEFSGLGARISIVGEALEIEGGSLKGGSLDSHNDHRIAMAGAVAGLSSETGVSVHGWKCVSKSYPRFFEDLKSLGGDVS